MTKEALTARRLELIAALNTIGQAPLDTPAGKRREGVVAELRNVNEWIKRLNIDEARKAKSDADRRKARGMAEHVANLQRSGALPIQPLYPAPPVKLLAHQMPGEFVLSLAKRLRKQLRQFKTPAPHTGAFLPQLKAFIDAQEAFLVAEASARAASAPDEWEKIWQDHHGQHELACAACGTDSSVGCVAGR